MKNSTENRPLLHKKIQIQIQILQIQYNEYDANENITVIKEAYTSGSTIAYRPVAEYTYDELNQLKTETRKVYTGTSTTPTTTTVVTYVIDTAGNISSVETKVNGIVTDTVEYTYGNAYWSDRLTAITVNGTSKNISYATYLNPSSWYNGTQFTNLTWTQGRRLSSLTVGNSAYSYEYDMSGIRTVKIANGLKHEYVTQSGRVVREVVTNASTGAFQYALDFTYDEAGHPLTMRKYNNANMQNNYITMQYVCNAQGDVVKLIYNGTVYAEYTYDAWGNVLTPTENGSYNYAALNPLRYRGYYYDTETGFYYLQSRYYDPIVKRFLNADSYSSTGQGFVGCNMFAYCNNTPINGSDPSGHFFIELLREWLYGTGQEVAMADGPAPVGDAVYVAGLGALGFLTLLELGYNAISSSVSSTTVDGVSGASVKAFNNTVHQKQLSDIASKYGLYECKEAAEAMAKQDNNKKGYLIQLYFPNAYNGNVCAPNSEYGWKTAISKATPHKKTVVQNVAENDILYV